MDLNLVEFQVPRLASGGDLFEMVCVCVCVSFLTLNHTVEAAATVRRLAEGLVTGSGVRLEGSSDV